MNANAIELVENEEDKLFLQSPQKKGHSGYMTRVDTRLTIIMIIIIIQRLSICTQCFNASSNAFC